MSSSPGFPWTSYDTNMALLLEPGKVEDIIQLVELRLAELATGVNSHLGIIRLMIKREGHKMTKIAEGRYRLISSLNLVDQVVGRLLCGPLDAYEKDNFHEVGVKVGMTDVNSDLPKVLYSLKDGAKSHEDATTYDWTAPLEHYEFNKRVRLLTIHPKSDPFTGAVMTSFYDALIEGRYFLVDSEGVVYEIPSQTWIVISGNFPTLSDNGRAQQGYYIMHCIRGGIPYERRRIVSLGDDACTSHLTPEHRDKYYAFKRALGLTIKRHDVNSVGELEFCSRVPYIYETKDGEQLHVHQFVSYERQLWKLIFLSLPRHGPTIILDAMRNLATIPEVFDYLKRLYESYDDTPKLPDKEEFIKPMADPAFAGQSS